MDSQELILGRERIPELVHDSVHVWRVSTAAGSPDLSRFSEILSPEEIARSARFHFDKDCRAFVVCRGALRMLLAEYSQGDPRTIQFSYGEHGKPAQHESARPELRFNVSHSGEIALLAFALGREIGVDVERKRDGVDFEGLAKLSFSEIEYDAFLAAAPAARADVFYEYWSCKEACIKADGRGLSAGLRRFSVVGQSDDSQGRSVISEGRGALSSDMRIRLLTVDEGYAAAVAAGGKAWSVRGFGISQSKI